MDGHSLDSFVILFLVSVLEGADEFTLSSLAFFVLVCANMAQIPDSNAAIVAGSHKFEPALRQLHAADSI